MWKWLVLVLGLLLSTSPALAGPFGKDPIGDAQGALEGTDEKSAEELAEEERMKAFRDAQKGKQARVVVLKWADTDTDYSNQVLQRNIRNRIARPSAQFFPEIDLYQAGRKEPDRSVRHTEQRAVVPAQIIPRVEDAVDDISQIPYNALSEQEWGIRATELLELADEVWFADRPDLREPLFRLYVYIGYAAENTNTGSPPFYEVVGGRTVNYYWYLAATLALDDPELLSTITNNDLYQSVQYYRDELERGNFDMLNLAFDQDGEFDGEQFAKDFEVFINGDAIAIDNPDGILQVPLGRVDIYLKRDDGHGLSDRLDLDRLRERFYFVVDNAWKTMGLDFQEQLMDHPFECTPPLRGDILNYLSIYAKLHPQSEIFIAVPKYGSVAPGRIFLWRWERSTGQLVRVQDSSGGFPVRFALMFSTGAAFRAFKVDENLDLEQAVVDQANVNPGEPPTAGDLLNAVTPELIPDGVPVDLQLRAHYNRLLLGVGLAYKVTLGENYEDFYQTDGNFVVNSLENAGEDGSVEVRNRALQRLVYSMLGVVLGRDYNNGYGMRGFIRVGWTNVPHAVEVTGHAGITSRLFKKDEEDEDQVPGRTTLLADFDVFAGAAIPVPDSFFLGEPSFTFGFTGGLGVTF